METILALEPVERLSQRFGRRLVIHLVRRDLDDTRADVRNGKLDPEGMARKYAGPAVSSRLERAAKRVLEPRPRPVINATGVVVHTNLGRSLLSAAAAHRVAEAAVGYMDLEYDLATGRRGSRSDHLSCVMEVLFPGHGFVVVNNNAAAIMLALRALARRREVVVSRGELVEIGGSFRVPDILAASGARLREVGTTNRTRLSDFEDALGDRTGLILKVHTSNFRVVGFTEETPLEELVGLSRRTGVPVVVDWGSGDLVDLEPLGIRDEVPVNRILDAGADLVTFSGDKLLGGPQAGFVVGRPDLVSKLRKDPMARVSRLDRMMTAALHETLCSYVRGRAMEDVPTLRMLALDRDAIADRARRVGEALRGSVPDEFTFELRNGVSRPGGGSSPTGERETVLIALEGPKRRVRVIERRLRTGRPAVLARIADDRLLIDLRTVLPEQDDILTARLREVLSGR